MVFKPSFAPLTNASNTGVFRTNEHTKTIISRHGIAAAAIIFITSPLSARRKCAAFFGYFIRRCRPCCTAQPDNCCRQQLRRSGVYYNKHAHRVGRIRRVIIFAVKLLYRHYSERRCSISKPEQIRRYIHHNIFKRFASFF